MDKTRAWSDMVSDTTVDTTSTNAFTVKSTGYEISRVSFCLAANTDDIKLPPVTVLKNAKRKVNEG